MLQQIKMVAIYRGTTLRPLRRLPPDRLKQAGREKFQAFSHPRWAFAGM